MIEHAKFWAIAALVGLAAPSLLALHPEAVRAQAVCGRLARTELFETRNYQVTVCDEGGNLALIVLDKRTGRSRWAAADQSGFDRYSARTGSTSYFVDSRRLTVQNNGFTTTAEPVLARNNVTVRQTSFLPAPNSTVGRGGRYDDGYRIGYEDGWRLGRNYRDLNSGYNPERAIGLNGSGSSTYDRGYRAGFFAGYADGYDSRIR